MKISEEDCKKVFELIGSIFFYGDFVAETYNERELEKLLRKNGYFFETEDELIEKLDPGIDFENPPPKPIFPPVAAIIAEGDTASGCPVCGSSRYKGWPFFRSKRCIQPKCKNYYGYR